MKRTKNQGFGMVVKAQISILCEISLRGALFCSLLNSLILPVIFCEASDKPLAFQFVNKTQQSQGQKDDLELGVRIYE
jgi:hypothetical protein